VEKDFLKKLKSGDSEAFQALLAQFQGRVRSICHRFLRNAEDAEDTAQDVFVDVYLALPEFREEAELSTWIYRIAVTRSIDAIRKKKRKKRLDEVRGVFTRGIALETAQTPSTADPACLLEGQERALVLRRAVESLPEKQRTAITLAKYEELGNKEIADIMGTTLVSVESLIYRANRNLRRKLFKYYARKIRRGGKDEPPV
jgi:RNA polymerase sigma-70 factor (ECF subfamily)